MPSGAIHRTDTERKYTDMERLQKVIAQAGIASRRKAEQLIAEGKVKVNGETDTRRGRKLYAGDIVTFDGEEIRIED